MFVSSRHPERSEGPLYFARSPTIVRSLIFTAALSLLLATRADAQDPPAAPLPSALAAAHKLFLGNAGDQENADCLRAYNDLYADLAKLSRFELIPAPENADLILEMHYEIAIGQSAGQNAPRQFRVVLLDPHAHVVLWSLTERTNYAVRQSNRDKNLDETVAKLVDDFASLTAAQPPNNKSRIRHFP